MWWLQSCREPGGGRWSHETHGGSGAALCQEAGVGATERVAAPELPRAGLRSWGHGTRGGTRAAMSQKARADATGGVAAPELPVPGGVTRCHGHVGVCERTSCHSS
jgi:hypothetical protein